MRGHCTACVSAIASQWHQHLLAFSCFSCPGRESPLHASAAVQSANQAAAAAMLDHPTIFIGQVRAGAHWCTDKGLVAAAAGLAITT